MVQEQVRVSRYLVRITPRTPSTTNHKQTGGSACCKRPRQRGTDASLTCFFGLVATCDVRGTYPTQKLPLFFNLIQIGPRRNNFCISENPRPGKILKSSKKQNYSFFHSYVLDTSYVESNPTCYFVVHCDMGRRVVSLSRVVEYLCLACSGPSIIDYAAPNHSIVLSGIQAQTSRHSD